MVANVNVLLIDALRRILSHNARVPSRNLGESGCCSGFPSYRRRYAVVVLVGPAPGPRLDRAAGVPDVPGRGHPDRRALLSRPGALDVQVPLGSAARPLR